MRQISVDVKAACLESRGNTYEEAVKTLNTLQSNAAYIEKTKAERDQRRHLSLPETIQTANRAGITLEDIDQLSVIHVTGTKGKGSTCAFCENILRAHGYKTGFFSSPHLVEVRERLRINGRPITRDMFSAYFWDVYRKILNTKNEFGGNMPPYFRFLTVLAFQVFLKEQVDVAIIEVGIGGEFDCTNIVRSPVVCGVTSLGLDHISLLGDTIDKIAWHKAGIFKYGVPAVTVPQPEDSLQVLHNRAQEKKCPLYTAPDTVHSYDWGEHTRALGIPGAHQGSNASLAVQLCTLWLENHTKSLQERLDLYKVYTDSTLGRVEYLVPATHVTLTQQMTQGLRDCCWPGRCQVLERPGISYYLDGAHTPRSIQACAEWFTHAAKQEAASVGGKIVRVLLFNTTGDRKPESLLEHLLECCFDFAVFCPNLTNSATVNKADQSNFMVTNEMQLAKCRDNRTAWLRLQVCDKSLANTSSASTSASATVHNGGGDMLTSDRCKHQVRENGDTRENTHGSQNGDTRGSQNGDTHSSENEDAVTQDTSDCSGDSHLGTQAAAFNSIQQALQWVSQGRNNGILKQSVNVEMAQVLQEADHVQVLCTGSIHLVGGILGLLDPDICDK